jgi:hypothetical protein
MVPTELEKALATGDRVIGYLTWFDCEEARITPMELKRLFNQHGLDDKYIPQDIKPKNAFQKACRKAITKVGHTSDDRRSVVKLIVDGMEKTIYGIVDLNVNQVKENITPDFSDKVWFEKSGWAVNYEHGHPTAKVIKQLYTQMCGEYTTRDISRMIVRGMDKMCSVQLRRAGVIYFVPTQMSQDLQALQAVVNNIGHCDMKVFAVGNGHGNAMGVEREARSQINDKIATMKVDIDELKQSIEDGTIKGKAIENSIEVRLRRYRELKERCGILSDALKFKAEGLMEEIDGMAKLIRTELEAA